MTLCSILVWRSIHFSRPDSNQQNTHPKRVTYQLVYYWLYILIKCIINIYKILSVIWIEQMSFRHQQNVLATAPYASNIIEKFSLYLIYITILKISLITLLSFRINKHFYFLRYPNLFVKLNNIETIYSFIFNYHRAILIDNNKNI